MKQVIASFSTLLFAMGVAFAGDSTFSKDGEHVYLVPYHPSALIEINLKNRLCRRVELASSFNEQIQGVTLSNSGFILCATKTAVWAYDPSNEKCVKVIGAPLSKEIEDIAYDPTTKATYVTAGSPSHSFDLYCMPSKSDEWKTVWNRRGPAPSHPVFSSDGTLFFAGRGDLWMGGIQKEKPNSDPERYGVLVAQRCAPLAHLETQECNESSTGIHEIAISGKLVYARYSRLGGSGWGSIIRFQRPTSIKWRSREEMDIPVEISPSRETATIIASIEMLEECSGLGFVCASRDGNRVLYMNEESIAASDVFLVKNDEKPERVHISDLAELLK